MSLIWESRGRGNSLDRGRHVQLIGLTLTRGLFVNDPSDPRLEIEREKESNKSRRQSVTWNDLDQIKSEMKSTDGGRTS